MTIKQIASLLLLLCAIQYTQAYKYLGCYQDKIAATDRDLIGSLFLEDNVITPEFCEEKCANAGFKYYGLQYGSECWCGNSYGKHGKLDDSKCDVPCSGDKTIKCGGNLVNSIYEVTIQPTKSASNANDDRPLLGLVMIVKDEAHTLPNTLLTIKPYLDYYFILDTGSTDGTQEAIRRTLGPKGEIWEEPFIDYGRSRNRVLDIAQQSKNKPIFVLMLSADETVYNAASLRKFCEENRNAEGAMHEAYPIVMDVGWRFDSVRLSRVDKGWRYVGRVHEYLAAPDQKWHPSLRVPNAYIKFRVTDPERRSNREYTIKRILEEEKAEKPYDTRTSFYLARTYNVIGNHSAALAEFHRRVSLGGWQEEVYESLYAIAWQLEALGRPWSEIQQAFLDAHEHSPERAEPLYSIASRYYNEKKMALAYLFASHAASLEYPAKAVLWVQTAVYEWQCNFLVGMTGLKIGKNKEGARALLLALKKKPGDAVMEAQLTKYKAVLSMEEFARIEQAVNGGAPIDNAPAQAQIAAATPNAPTKVANPNKQPVLAVKPGVEFDNPNVLLQNSEHAASASVFRVFITIAIFVGAISGVIVMFRRKKGVRGMGGEMSDKVV